MAEVTLPALREGCWLAIIIENQPVAGREFWAVTIRAKAGQRAKRRWFSDEAEAVAHAATAADEHGLPFFDLREPGTGE